MDVGKADMLKLAAALTREADNKKYGIGILKSLMMNSMNYGKKRTS